MAADARDDGPFCRLSAVAHRCDKRLLADVLDHAPTHDDIRTFLRRVNPALSARHLTRVGLTTDGAARSPEPLAAVFDAGPHQVCALHGVTEVVKAVVRAVASARKTLAATQPKVPTGRPATLAATPAAPKNKRLEQQANTLQASEELLKKQQAMHSSLENFTPDAYVGRCPRCCRS